MPESTRSSKPVEKKINAQNNSGQSSTDAQSETIQDNRSGTLAQMKVVEAMSEGPRPQKTAQLQAMMHGNSAVQKATDEEEVQKKAAPIQKKENNTGLPDNLKSGVENLSGVSMNDVKVHTNSDQPAQMQAHAFAQGTDIHVAPGQEQHLPHEAWHVVQQKQGRVKPTTQMKGGIPVNDDIGLENEADVMGAKASKTVNEIPTQLKSNNRKRASSVLQREGDFTALETIPEVEEKNGTEELESKQVEQDGNDKEESVANQQDVAIDEKKQLTLKEIVSGGKAVVDNIKGFADTLGKKPDSIGEKLVSSSTGLLESFKGAVNIISFLADPLKSMIFALMSLKTKWAQWNVFNKAAENGVPEAVYALGKIMKGFAGGIGKFLWNTFKFVSRILAFTPAAVVAGTLMIFQASADAFSKVAKSVKGLWQTFTGEKKDKFSKKLLDRAVNGEKDALKLIFDLKLGSIMGSDFWIVNQVTILKNEVTSTDNLLSHAPDFIKDKVDSIDRRELIFNSDEGSPSSADELHERLKAISGSENSKKVIQDEIKSTMTGFGK